MAIQFVKGYTNNHLTWVMVDATDFATPESALSAATKIKIYGKVKGATGANFVSSGTGSLTNDIQHVGASALGIYTIALAKADLSDASAAWYDQYIISLSATGAAYQTLIVDGGIWISDLSAIASDIRSDVSDMHSDLIVMSDVLSNVYSACTALSDAASNILSCVRGNSDVLSNMSNILSDFYSDFQSRVPKAVATNSQLSDLASDIKSAVAGVTATVSASDISDIASAVWATAIATKTVSLSASDLSDLRSAIAAGPAATITASDISDIVSAVWGAKWDVHSVASSFGSMFEVLASSMSDLTSRVSSTPANKSQLASATYALMASQLSDILSAATQVNSRVVVAQSYLSDIRSDVSDMHSDLLVMSGILSDAYSGIVALSGLVSDAHSAAVVAQSISASDFSDIRSAIAAGPAAAVTASDISDIASAVRAALVSDLSDIMSAATAIKAKTDGLTFTVANQVDANIQYVNDILVTGAGTAGDPWGP